MVKRWGWGHVPQLSPPPAPTLMPLCIAQLREMVSNERQKGSQNNEMWFMHAFGDSLLVSVTFLIVIFTYLYFIYLCFSSSNQPHHRQHCGGCVFPCKSLNCGTVFIVYGGMCIATAVHSVQICGFYWTKQEVFAMGLKLSILFLYSVQKKCRK